LNHIVLRTHRGWRKYPVLCDPKALGGFGLRGLFYRAISSSEINVNRPKLRVFEAWRYGEV
jgi:hypothetical protein